MPTTIPQPEARELLAIDESDAWGEYLESTRHEGLFTYDEVEPWAWARLVRRLRVIAARRKALR